MEVWPWTPEAPDTPSPLGAVPCTLTSCLPESSINQGQAAWAWGSVVATSHLHRDPPEPSVEECVELQCVVAESFQATAPLEPIAAEPASARCGQTVNMLGIVGPIIDDDTFSLGKKAVSSCDEGPV